MKFSKHILFLLILFQAVTPNKSDAKEFLNTIMHINIGWCINFPFGDIINEEKKFSVYSEYDEEYKKPIHYGMSLNLSMDIAPFPPLILGNEAHAIKIGLRAGYRFHKLKQSLIINETRAKKMKYGDNLMGYHTWLVGPVIRYAPSIEISGLTHEYTAKGGFTFFCLFGQVFNGEAIRYPAYRNIVEKNKENDYTIKNTPDTSTGDNITTMKGFTMDIGIGGEISVGAVNLGINVFYSYYILNIHKKLYDNISKKTTLSEICIEIYMGIPIVW